MKILKYIIFTCISVFSLNAQIIFTDVTTTANIAFNASSVESLAWGDYDNDGDEDLFLSTDGQNRLMRNDGNDKFTDVSLQVGLSQVFNTTGCAFGDLDNDGDLDLFIVTTVNTDPDFLYENLGASSNYNFQLIPNTTSNISNLSSVRGMSLLDFNRDNLLDIYVNANGQDIVYKNLGNFQFSEVSNFIGINANDVEVGSVPTDINNDGWIDIFTGNRSAVNNKLFLNNGNGIFTDISTTAGINEKGLGMGVLSFDYDNDLDMDLYWTTWPGNNAPFQSNALYQNQGDNTFINKALETNTLDSTGWGISCNAGDIDNDGFEDFFVSNGFSSTSTQSLLFRNNNGVNFQDITSSVLGNLTWDGRGVAFADYDNDGDLDICLTGGVGVDTKLWRNDSVNSNNWVILKLEGTTSNRSAIGARVEITAGGQTLVKEVSGGAGRGSFNSLPVEFGLGTASTISNVKVRWPNGNIENFNNININKKQTLIEGASTLLVNDYLLKNNSIKIFPNPSKNVINLNLGELSGQFSVKIFTSRGRLIHKEAFDKKNNIAVNIKNYKGLLYVIIDSVEGKFVKKVILY